MHFRTSLMALLLLALPVPALAFLDKIPFLGDDDYPFEIQMDTHERLKEDLGEILIEQRKSSNEFELYSSSASVINFDRAVFKKVLESRGYYAAKIAGRLREQTIVYTIQPGERYKVAEIRFQFPSNVTTPSRYLLPLQEGQPLIAEEVLATVDAIAAYLQANYCLFNVSADYKAEINHATHLGFVTFRLAPSQNVVFAKPQLFGEAKVAHDYLYKQINFNKGQCFNRTVIEKARVALLQTNLLARVDTVISEPIAGEVAVSFDVTERNHRTVKAGVGYASDLGSTALLGWGHRNIFGSGQKLDISLNYSKVEQSLESELTLPYFLRDDQHMVIEADITRERTSAYEALQGETLATINRKLSRYVTASLGAGLGFSRVENDESTDDYSLLSFPIGLEYNDTGSVFDPKNGLTLAIKTRPYVNLYQTGERFIEHTGLFTAYHTFDNWPGSPTLAYRLAAGTLSDAVDDEVPLDHRFYVGGGGSLRGYDYQSVSALDDQTPLGGLSFSETSFEIRMMLSESWGLVLFADGGFAYAEQTPKFYEDYLWAAGLGIRFHTTFAPIRFDIARPLDIRYSEVDGNRIDSPFQLYISLGQAF